MGPYSLRIKELSYPTLRIINKKLLCSPAVNFKNVQQQNNTNYCGVYEMLVASMVPGNKHKCIIRDLKLITEKYN
jgi:hypothetical protein